MNSILQDIEAAAQQLPFSIEVTTNILDEDRLPMVVVERQDVQDTTTSPINIQGDSDATVFLAFQQDILWEDIEQVTGAFVKGFKDAAPASDVNRIQYGRGASGIRLVELRISTGYALSLDALPSDFRFQYSR